MTMSWYVLLLCACALGGSVFCDTQQSTIHRKPHIIVIMPDAMGYNDVGYHDSDVLTPNIDSIAEGGTKLKWHYMLPTKVPGGASFLTGHYQTEHGVYKRFFKEDPQGLTHSLPLLSEQLQQNGYSTHLIGKWALGYYKEEFLPTNRGFDNFTGIVNNAADHSEYDSCVKMNGKSWCGTTSYINDQPTKSFRGQYSTNLFGRKAVETIQEHAQTNSQKSLFMYLSFMAPHEPVQVPNKALETYDYSHIKNHKRRVYLTMISRIDHWIREIKEELETQGMWDDTLLLFTSGNNGPAHIDGNGASNWPLRGGKGTFFEGGIRTVAFVAGGFLPVSHHVFHDVIHVTDWYPTFLYLAGVSINRQTTLPGRNVWNDLVSNSQTTSITWRKVLLGMYLTKTGGEPTDMECDFDNRIQAAIRKGPWKLITGVNSDTTRVPPWGSDIDHTPNPQPEKALRLYNIYSDPHENHNVAEQHEEVVRRLCEALQKYKDGAVPVPSYGQDFASRPRAANNFTWRSWK